MNILKTYSAKPWCWGNVANSSPEASQKEKTIQSICRQWSSDLWRRRKWRRIVWWLQWLWYGIFHKRHWLGLIYTINSLMHLFESVNYAVHLQNHILICRVRPRVFAEFSNQSSLHVQNDFELFFQRASLQIRTQDLLCHLYPTTSVFHCSS